VQDGTLFRDVDFFAAEHRVNTRPQARFFSSLKKKFEGFVRDAVLGVIEI